VARTPPSPIAARLTAQALAGEPLAGPVAVAERLLAVQAQDPRGARLAVRARTEGLTAAAVDAALTEDRSLLITWLNRGTLHLVRREDYPWLQLLTTPPLLTSNATRLRQEGVSEAQAEKGVATISAALAAEGPMTRPQLRDRLDAAGVPTRRQALVHVLFLAALRGLTVRGPMVGGEQAFVLVEDWLGPQARLDRGSALAELARRYLAGHGPADDRDLARWAGLPLRDARAALEAIAPELEQRPDGLLGLLRRAPAAPLPPPRLLGSFEPLLLGWVSREDVVGPHKLLVTDNGIFRPFALVEGRAVATWKLGGKKLEVEHLGRVTKKVAAALEADAHSVLVYLER
jgi:hypothetical protein